MTFRDAIKNAFGACDSSFEQIEKKSGVSRQVIWNMFKGRCKMRNGSARAVAETMVDEINNEIVHAQQRVCMLEILSKNVKETFIREYGKEGEVYDWPEL